MALGRAFIEVHADTRPFARQIGPEVTKIVRSVEKVIKDDTSLGDAVAESISDGIDRNKEQVSSSVSRSLSRSRTKVRVDVDVDVDKNRFTKTIGKFAEAVQGGAAKALNLLGDSAINATDGLQRVVGSMLNLSTVSLPVAVAVLTLAAFVLPVLLSATIALGGALSNLIGLLPLLVSGFGVLMAAIFPVVVAFQGFGDALSAVFSKDPEKLAEALKKLTPSARSVVLEFQKMLPFFDKLKAATQESFFGPLKGVMTPIIKTLQGPLLAGFTMVADAAGRFLAALLKIGGTPQFSAFTGAMFQGAKSLFDTLQGPVILLLDSLMRMAIASLPFFDNMVKNLGGFLTKFSEWINRNIENGKFQEFMQKAETTFIDIKELIKEVTALFKEMFMGTEEGGRTFLQLVTVAVRKLTDFFKSPDGKKAMEAMVLLAQLFGAWLIAAAHVAIFLLNILTRVANAIKSIVKTINGIDMGGIRPGFTRGGVVGGPIPFAEGGVVNRPTLALMGEDFKSEAVIPLTDPKRAQQIADQSGLSAMLSGGGDTFIFYLGEQEIHARIVRIANGVVNSAGKQLTDGARAA